MNDYKSICLEWDNSIIEEGWKHVVGAAALGAYSMMGGQIKSSVLQNNPGVSPYLRMNRYARTVDRLRKKNKNPNVAINPANQKTVQQMKYTTDNGKTWTSV